MSQGSLLGLVSGVLVFAVMFVPWWIAERRQAR